MNESASLGGRKRGSLYRTRPFSRIEPREGPRKACREGLARTWPGCAHNGPVPAESSHGPEILVLHFLRELPMNTFLRPFVLSLLVASAGIAGEPAQEGFSRLPLSRQLALREDWLGRKQALLLSMMRRHGISMWIVVNEEFHDDPLTPFLVPAEPQAGGRDLFVFVDTGESGLRKVALAGYYEEPHARFFEAPEEPKPAKEALPALVAETRPKTIALSIDGQRGVTRSLTRSSYQFLVEVLGPEVEKRFVPAEPLIEEYLDTRLPEERAPYLQLVRLTENLVKRALSAEVIQPGRTTAGDLRRFLYDQLDAAGVTTWFRPDVRIQRRNEMSTQSKGFLSVAKDAAVIARGDLLHIDFGITYLGLNTDWQKMAYVLREGETQPPAGLRAALARTNAVQEAVMQESRPGRSSAEVYAAAMARMKIAGIEAQIYSHPLGNHGHGLGASIDSRAAASKDGLKKLRKGSWLALELNSRSAIPEWDNQVVWVMEEDPVWLSDEGWISFVPRQTEFYLVK